MRCLALFTGGLDAQIAVRMMQRQGVEVVGLYVQTPFTPSPNAAQAAASRLDIELLLENWSDGYLDLVRRPRFGFAAEMAPCLDCRSGMLRRAKVRMLECSGSFLISGDVIGQRPSSLRSRDLETMAMHGGVDDLLLRPLSAKLLPPTLPERNGWVNRELLHGWHGKGRREQLRLAQEWELHESADHQPGCLLLQELYSRRLKRTLALSRLPSDAELRSLAVGRHYSLGDSAHVVVSRNADDGARLRALWEQLREESWMFEPLDFRGPVALLFGPSSANAIDATIALCAAAGKDVVAGRSTVRVASGTAVETRIVPQSPPADWTPLLWR